MDININTVTKFTANNTLTLTPTLTHYHRQTNLFSVTHLFVILNKLEVSR